MTERNLAPAGKSPESAKLAAVHHFLRSLNILLKSVRLYGVEHARSGSQLRTAWDDLYSCLQHGEDLRLSAAGSKLLVDGEAMRATPAEVSFAELLEESGISSVHFSPHTTAQDFSKFAHVFAAAGPKLEGLSKQLKAAFAGETATIHVNEVRFIAAEEPEAEETRVGTPLVAAAEDLRKPAGDVAGSASDTGESVRILRLLGMIGEMLADPNATIDFGRLREQLALLSDATRAQLPQVSAGLGGSESARIRLLDLAERLAAHFALMAQGKSQT
ncbi:MAG: hypothetical protein HY234_13940 [Acidobacteria bacterium]|nr:hypothetical protein [Acidobacteriota bacterium]